MMQLFGISELKHREEMELASDRGAEHSPYGATTPQEAPTEPRPNVKKWQGACSGDRCADGLCGVQNGGRKRQ